MKGSICKVASAILLSLLGSYAFTQDGTKQLGEGWIALTKQADPFNSASVEISLMFKDGFTFRCGELNMEADSTGYESLSFNAELRYIIDGGESQSKSGKYSTYLGGSDLVTDSRYYSFKLSNSDIEAMKKGSTIQVAGQFGGSGWTTRSLSLLGFSSAYSEMCG